MVSGMMMALAGSFAGRAVNDEHPVSLHAVGDSLHDSVGSYRMGYLWHHRTYRQGL